MISILHVPRTLITYFSGNKLLKKNVHVLKNYIQVYVSSLKYLTNMLLLLLILLFSVKFIVLAE